MDLNQIWMGTTLGHDEDFKSFFFKVTAELFSLKTILDLHEDDHILSLTFSGSIYVGEMCC